MDIERLFGLRKWRVQLSGGLLATSAEDCQSGTPLTRLRRNRETMTAGATGLSRLAALVPAPPAPRLLADAERHQRLGIHPGAFGGLFTTQAPQQVAVEQMGMSHVANRRD
jgi:hypothetical protein